MKYFIHDTNAFQDEKITQLFIAFGYEGVGLFFTILEKIALQEKPVNTSVLKKQLFVGKKLEKCWNFLETIDLISSNNGETFNKQLLNFSESFMIKKEKNRKRISEWRDKQADKENVTCNESVRNTDKVKVIKVKESKEEEIIINEIYNLYPVTCPNRNSSNGKSKKDRDKIKAILKTLSADELKEIVNRYVKECKSSKSYMKNFSTFLNNLPDYEQGNTANERPKGKSVQYKMYGYTYQHPEKTYNDNIISSGAENIQFIKYID